jgi:hypothetical protein
MKALAVLVLAAAMLAGSTPDAEARRFVATKAECRAECGAELLLAKVVQRTPGMKARCRATFPGMCSVAAVMRKCLTLGPAIVCPPTPPVTTTTLPAPVVTTTTTSTTQPYIPPTTTTTLPTVVNPALPYVGSWDFYGTLVMNTCPDSLPAGTYDTLTVTVLPASPGAAQGYLTSAPQITFSGGVTTEGDLGLEAFISNQYGCVLDTALLIDGPIASSTYSTAGAVGFDASCPAYPTVCRVVYTGTWTR